MVVKKKVPRTNLDLLPHPFRIEVNIENKKD